MKTKHTIFLLLILCIQYRFAFSQSNTTFNRTRITFHARNKTIKQIFQIIQSQTSFHINYSNTDIDKNLQINLDYNQEPLNKVLKDIAQICHFRFLVFKHTICVAQNSKNEQVINLKY